MSDRERFRVRFDYRDEDGHPYRSEIVVKALNQRDALLTAIKRFCEWWFVREFDIENISIQEAVEDD